jgi:REP element-mobilizing transposase RayT
MENEVDRKRPAHFHPIRLPNRSIIVFVTVCTWSRRPLLACPEGNDHLRRIWVSAPSWLVGRYVLMPDHLHLFCAPGSTHISSLAGWVKYWKSLAATTWPGSRVGRLWQRDFWDTQLRIGESYAAKWEYVRRNPVRAGLVTDPDEWPYQGELKVLHWHD